MSYTLKVYTEYQIADDVLEDQNGDLWNIMVFRPQDRDLANVKETTFAIAWKDMNSIVELTFAEFLRMFDIPVWNIFVRTIPANGEWYAYTTEKREDAIALVEHGAIPALWYHADNMITVQTLAREGNSVMLSHRGERCALYQTEMCYNDTFLVKFFDRDYRSYLRLSGYGNNVYAVDTWNLFNDKGWNTL